MIFLNKTAFESGDDFNIVRQTFGVRILALTPYASRQARIRTARGTAAFDHFCTLR